MTEQVFEEWIPKVNLRESQALSEESLDWAFRIAQRDIQRFSETVEPYLLDDDESLEIIKIEESEVGQEGRKWRVAIIESCVSDNSNWYQPHILAEAKSLFEGSPGRIYKFDGRSNSGIPHNDHVPGWVARRNAGTVMGNTVSVYDNIRVESIPSSRVPGAAYVPAITADKTFLDDRTRRKVWESYRAGHQNGDRNDLFQLSIEAEGPHTKVIQEGRLVNRVDGITNVREVTMVRKGAAGGLLLWPYAAVSQESSKGSSKVSKIESKTKKEIEQTFDNPDSKVIVGASSVSESLAKAGNEDPQPGSPEENSQCGISEEDAKKSIQILRTGNLELGIEMLQDALTCDDEEDDETPGDKAKAAKDKGKAMKSPAMKATDSKTKVESKQEMEPKNVKDVIQTEPGNGSIQSNFPSNSQGAQNHQSQFDAVALQESFKAHVQGLQKDHTLEIQGLKSEMDEFTRFLAAKDARSEAALQEAYQEIQSLRQGDQERRQNELLAESKRMLNTCLKESKLPPSTQRLIAGEFDGVILESTEIVEKRIEDHRNHIFKLSEALQANFKQENGSSMVQAPGHHLNLQMGGNRIDYIQRELDMAFGYVPTMQESEQYKGMPKVASIKRPMMLWHDDQDCRMVQDSIGPNAILLEATSTDTGLANLLQNSMTKSLMQRYNSQPALWREVSDVQAVSNFLEQQVMVMGGLGRLPVVVESGTGTTYLTLGFPATSQVTYNVGTFGGLVKITRQAIINDNLQGIQRFPQEAAESAVMTLNLQVFGTLIGKYGYGATNAINTANSYDGYDIYHANHFNYSTAALAYQSLVDMLTRADNQRRFANVGVVNNGGVINIGDSTFTVSAVNDFANSIKAGDKLRIHAEDVEVSSVSTLTITIVGTFASAHADGARVEQLGSPVAYDQAKLIVPTELRATAYQLLASALVPGSSTSDASFLFPYYQDKRLVPLAMHSMYLGDDLTNFYLAMGKPVRSGFLGGREEPELLLQDNPLVGNVFSGDLISWKVRHEHGHVLPEHRMVCGNIVA